jgi:NADPH:quinone reductase-like Zn-dependent oxidoreductase
MANEVTMKAAVYANYGAAEVLSVTEVEKPVPGDDEVLIAVHVTTVTSGDLRARSLVLPRGFGVLGRLVFGVFAPRQPILGTELAGRVEAVGKRVTRFKVGDDVFAFTGAKMGCYAEYKCVREDGLLALMPTNLSYAQAAALSFGGTTALDFLRKGQIKAGDHVLVNGASGGVGTACVAVARHFGAEVTGVCSTGNLELVRSMGASSVVDYTKEDFTKAGKQYDLIVDTVGTAPYSRSRVALKAAGRLLLVLGELAGVLGAMWVALTSKRRVIAGPASVKVEDLRWLARLAEAGEYEPAIDRVYPLAQIVEAHRYVDAGHKRGNVIITMPVAAGVAGGVTTPVR